MALGYPATGARRSCGRWSLALLVFLLWVAFHVWLALTTTDEAKQELREDLLDRIIAATALAAQQDHRLPAWQAPWAVDRDEDWIEGIDFYCEKALDRDEFPPQAFADWALAHFLIGDKKRADELLALARSELADADDREVRMVANYVAGEKLEADLRYWAEDEWTRGSATWPVLQVLSKSAEYEDERVTLKLWLQSTGTKIVQWGTTATMLGDLVRVLGVISLLILVVYRSRIPAPMPVYRLPAAWDLSAVVYLLFLTLFISALAAVLIWESLADAGLWTLGMVLACLSVLVVPTIWFIARFTPGCDAAMRLFGLCGCRKNALFPWRWTLILGMGVAGGMLVVNDVLESSGLADSWAEHPEDWLHLEFLDTPFRCGFGIVLAVVVAPFCEEYLHRGFVFGALRTKLPAFYAALLSSAVFATVHWYSWFGWVVIFVMGLLFCWLFQRTNSLWPGILAHGIYNLVVVCYEQAWFSY